MSSLPEGVHVELFRGRVIPGMEEEVDRWMQMLNDREAECVETLDRERMAVEAVFRLRDEQGEWLYWFCIRGDGEEMDDTYAIDRDHVAFAKRCKEPGWTKAELQLLLLPETVRPAVLAWAAHGKGAPTSPSEPDR
jgi:hypothetical protein